MAATLAAAAPGGRRPHRRPRGERVADRHGGGPARNFGVQRRRPVARWALAGAVLAAAGGALWTVATWVAGDGDEAAGSTVPMVATAVAVALAALALRWRGGDQLRRVASLPPQFLCPITNELMRDPVTTADGHTFERAPIERWLRTHDTSPMTGAPLAHKQLAPAIALRQLIQSQRRQAGGGPFGG